jgi:signal transduction histidine kinase
VNLNALIDELRLLVRHKLANQNVQLVRALQPELPVVMGDATQLEQAFLNLILNAAEAMPNGGTLTISTRLIRTRGQERLRYVVVEFKDTGEGMTEEQRRRAFSSVLSTTKTKGTGLGLAIVGRIVETHRGKLKIKSQRGRGTTIVATFPVE